MYQGQCNKGGHSNVCSEDEVGNEQRACYSPQ